MNSLNEYLMESLDFSHSEYHSVEKMKETLIKNNFIELHEGESFNLKAGQKYFVVRNLTSIIAFKLPSKIDGLYFKVFASHTDSPAYKIKENPVLIENGYEKLKVEGYGGMIISSWLDKPLGIAGRIVVKEDNKIKSKLIDSFKDVAIIPNVAIHQNREINNGFKYNNQIDLCPIIGEALKEGTNYEYFLNSFISKGEKVLATDLYLYNRNKATYVGINNDYIASPKLDDLASGFISLKGFIDSEDFKGVPVFAALNNEEVGSLSISGADSTFLYDILRRISLFYSSNEEDYYKAIAKSFLISIDNAHAIHPNHPELSDNKNQCYINKGIVIKHNSNMLYTTDALSSALIKSISEINEIPYQEFFNRSDARGGSTLGNISNSHVSLVSVDIGLPQLAMHSNFEVIGSKDTLSLYNLVKGIIDTPITFSCGSFILK